MSTVQSIKQLKRLNVGMENINSAIRALDTDGVDDAETIQYATAMLNELDEAHAHLLAIRARAFLKQAKFDQAIADASKAIDACPTSGKFYLVASQLYIAHGKPKLAIDVLEDGICSTLPSDWPSLYDEREAAKRLLEAKVDFVLAMPPEITARIFTWLPKAYVIYINNVPPLNPTAVSKTWRAAAFNCSSLWKFAHRTGYGKRNVVFEFFPLVCNYVEDLDICGLSQQQSQELMSVVSPNMLQYVTKMSLSESVPPNTQLYLVSVLGKQLTELKLDIAYDRGQDDTFALDTLLETCKNLKALTLICCNARIRYHPPRMPNANILNIEMLSIFTPVGGDYASDVFLYQLIPRCHQLRFLNLPRYPPSILEVFAGHCLQLEEIAIIAMYDSRKDIWKKEYKKQTLPTTGLKRFEYANSGDNAGELRDLVPLWVRYKDTLREIDLKVCEADIATMEQEDWDSVLSHNYPYLKSLVIEHREDDDITTDRTLELLQLCPNLEHVVLSVETALPTDFFASFAGLSNLRQLRISRLNLSCAGFQHYLEHLATLDQKSNLKKVYIFDCEAMTDQNLSALAGVSSLEQIEIYGRCALISTSGITAFLQKLKSNPSIQFLDLRGMANLDTNCLPVMEELVELNSTGNKYLLTKLKQYGTDPQNPHYNVIFDRRKDSPYF
ncbi:hypothetical protein BJV82DRAFT_662563 [Fennellomyces sp. T-0311]|nr:hypothetical protein BJV82DRAFT_662563 [Fennellomyces sp. T-0311]